MASASFIIKYYINFDLSLSAGFPYFGKFRIVLRVWFISLHISTSRFTIHTFKSFFFTEMGEGGDADFELTLSFWEGEKRAFRTGLEYTIGGGIAPRGIFPSSSIVKATTLPELHGFVFVLFKKAWYWLSIYNWTLDWRVWRRLLVSCSSLDFVFDPMLWKIAFRLRVELNPLTCCLDGVFRNPSGYCNVRKEIS